MEGKFFYLNGDHNSNFLQVSSAEDSTWAARSMLSLSQSRVEELEANVVTLLQELEDMKSKLKNMSDEKSPSKVICFRK